MHSTNFLSIEHEHLLQRTFTVRFRCLLDNTSGFVVRRKKHSSVNLIHWLICSFLDIGNRWTNRNSLWTKTIAYIGWSSFISIIRCSMSIWSTIIIRNTSTREFIQIKISSYIRSCFTRSKVRLNLLFNPFKTLLSSLFRGKLILNYTDHDLTQIGSGYNWIHSDDLKYYATAHKECKIDWREKIDVNLFVWIVLKTGTSGLVCYRLQTKDGRWQWLQSSMRIIYKSNKPDFVIANHRPLT